MNPLDREQSLSKIFMVEAVDEKVKEYQYKKQVLQFLFRLRNLYGIK